jgi:hypothetical protein
MEEAEMGKACSMYGGEKKYIQITNQKAWKEENTCENKV